MQPKLETPAGPAAAALAADPRWFKDAIIYELHVKAFYDSVDDGIGDFAGLMQRLDYIQDLGITALWLLPFYPSPLRDDGYDISDYYSVHPAYGTLRDFRQFVRQAHQRGLRVITELVLNHTSDQHPWFQRARQAPSGSSERDFYVWSDSDQKYSGARIIFTDTEKSNWTWDPVAQAYYWHRFFSHQPDLNYDSPRVRREVLKVMRFWFDLGVDGLRLDAVPYLIERDGTNCENLPETHAVLKELRRELDKHYGDRMLLAEANQWPSEVLPYFGAGDECHMAFHFPLMPRMFMALRQEDRHPITEILRQTPPIPDNCQWALFLRNHDELTLEMVTDEERDYMYKEYAADPKMRVNLGIRRRLATLVEHSRRRIELLTSLLFSFPGTPVIYYGDEIGMGDNIYLGDRNGVRTPMQWSGDRNGGFSRADPAKLYSPVVMDPIGGYQAVNVESQQRNPSSMLNFTKRMIALRKQHRTFGRGTIEFLHPQNRKVLAYLRRHEGETILCVANLSRFVQPAELDLAALRDFTPVEMMGRTEFPRIGDLPYFITLGPHAFYWFLLEREPARLAMRAAPEPKREAELPRLAAAGGPDQLLQGTQRSALERSAIRPYLARQRWFLGGGRPVKSLKIVDWALLQERSPTALLVFVKVRFVDGDVETYSLPLAVSAGSADGASSSAGPDALALVSDGAGEALLQDALASDAAAQLLLEALREQREWTTQSGTVQATAAAGLEAIVAQLERPLKIVRRPCDTNNSLLFLGHRLVLKVYRKLEGGLNPDIEVTRHLAEKTAFRRAPRLLGTIQYQPPKGEPIALAALQELLPQEGSGWDHALEEVRRYLEWAKGQMHPPQPALDGQPLLERAAAEPAPAVREAIGAYLTAAATLGQRTAELHLALAEAAGDPDFAPEPLLKGDVALLTRGMLQHVRAALRELKQNLDRLPDDLRDPARRLLRERQFLLDQVTSLAGQPLEGGKIRCHGDYHLRQVLRRENDFHILDFEGDPARPLSERRRKGCPLTDVASMLRSFNRAAYAALFAATQDRPDDFAPLEPWVTAWCGGTAAEFLHHYLRTAAGAAFLPQDREQLGRWLQAFLLERACGEIVQDLQSRPAWVRVPLMAILGWNPDQRASLSRPDRQDSEITAPAAGDRSHSAPA